MTETEHEMAQCRAEYLQKHPSSERSEAAARWDAQREADGLCQPITEIERATARESLRKAAIISSLAARRDEIPYNLWRLIETLNGRMGSAGIDRCISEAAREITEPADGEIVACCMQRRQDRADYLRNRYGVRVVPVTTGIREL